MSRKKSKAKAEIERIKDILEIVKNDKIELKMRNSKIITDTDNEEEVKQKNEINNQEDHKDDSDSKKEITKKSKKNSSKRYKEDLDDVKTNKIKRKIMYPKDDSESKGRNKKSKSKSKNKKKSMKSKSRKKKKNKEDTESESEESDNKKKRKKKRRTTYPKGKDIEMEDETYKKTITINMDFKTSKSKYDYLPCRDEEQEKIYNFIIRGLETNGNYNSLYIAGMPGTGKTACVNTVINAIEEELNDENNTNKDKDEIIFTKLFISGTDYPNINYLYKTIYNFIFSSKRKMGYNKCLQLLDKFFKERDDIDPTDLNDPSNSHIILVVDEIDFLINKNQKALYNLFNWTTYPYSKLILISISNTLDLPNRFLPKIRSRMGNNKIMFKPYNKEQLITIIKSKGIDCNKFTNDAIKFTCVKVSAINGDLRRTIQILLKAKEIYNLQKNKKHHIIDKDYVIQACDELFNSKLKKVISSLQVCEKIILGAILLKIKDDSNQKVNLGRLYDRIDVFLNKYNESVDEEEKITLYWEEYKTIIFNLVRLQLLIFTEKQNSNFMENFVSIKFYVEEFMNACVEDENFKPVFNFLTYLLNN